MIGLEVGGQVRAYPQQILAFHELTRDELGGAEDAHRPSVTEH